jgi:Chlorophyll A-B binding protein
VAALVAACDCCVLVVSASHPPVSCLPTDPDLPVHVQALTKAGVLNVPEWYEAGKVSAEQTGIALGPLLAVQLFLTGFVEGKRWMDLVKPGSQAEAGSFLGFEASFKGTDNGYPGGPFDPMGMCKCVA